MKYILIAGIGGAGKTSLIGVLKGFELITDDVYDDRNDNSKEISYCLENNLTFTQETTLAGHRIEKTIRQARKQGYDIVMFYVGLNSVEESVLRIANRVRKGGHDIPEEYVRLRYQNRIESLKRVLPLCDEVVFMITKTVLSKWQKSKTIPSIIQTDTDRSGFKRLNK